jgi:hybrid cluster-associated redox disulfide protein
MLERMETQDDLVERAAIALEVNVAELLKRWPQTIPVFLKYKTACVGCSLASFETLYDVVNNYGIPPDQLLQDLRNAIGNVNT